MPRISIRRKQPQKPTAEVIEKAQPPEVLPKTKIEDSSSSDAEPAGFAEAFNKYHGGEESKQVPYAPPPSPRKKVSFEKKVTRPIPSHRQRMTNRPPQRAREWAPTEAQNRFRAPQGPRRRMDKPRNRYAELRMRGASDGKLQYGTHYSRYGQPISHEDQVNALLRTCF